MDFTKLLGIPITAYSSFGPQVRWKNDIGDVTLISASTISRIMNSEAPRIFLACWITTRLQKLPRNTKSVRSTNPPKVKVFTYSCSAAPSQVLLRWATQRGIAVIPKSNKPQRIAENLLSTSFNLDESDIKEISSLNGNIRVRCNLSASPYITLTEFFRRTTPSTLTLVWQSLLDVRFGEVLSILL